MTKIVLAHELLEAGVSKSHVAKHLGVTRRTIIRWSQATERLIGSGFIAKRQPTLLFNGYEDYVAHMYEGMDLAVHY